MKTFLKHLLVLALMVLVFSGCQNPSDLNTDNEFKWGTTPQVSAHVSDRLFCSHLSRYLLGLYFDQNGNSYYKYPKGYDKDKYKELYNNEECLKKFYEDAFEKVFGTKYYKEGTVIDLKICIFFLKT